MPLDPSLDATTVQQAGQALIDELPYTINELPFTAKDCYELWLLSAHDKLPLALLASTTGANTIATKPKLDWQPNLRIDHSFVAGSQSTSTAGPAYNHREILASLINSKAGNSSRAQWFKRDSRGSGVGMIVYPDDDASLGRELGNEDFPELLLRDAWEKESDYLMVQDFYTWQAPLLLTLPHISTATRRKLEPLACREPLKVHALHRLYPLFLDQELLKKTLVQAQLLKAAEH